MSGGCLSFRPTAQLISLLIAIASTYEVHVCIYLTMYCVTGKSNVPWVSRELYLVACLCVALVNIFSVRRLERYKNHRIVAWRASKRDLYGACTKETAPQ